MIILSKLATVMSNYIFVFHPANFAMYSWCTTVALSKCFCPVHTTSPTPLTSTAAKCPFSCKHIVFLSFRTPTHTH